MTLYVPGESMNAYKTTAPWSGFGKFQTLTTGIEKTETAAKPMITTADGQIAVSGLSGNATIQVFSLDGKLFCNSCVATLGRQDRCGSERRSLCRERVESDCKIVAITRRQDWAVAQSCLFYLKNYAIKSYPMQILYQD